MASALSVANQLLLLAARDGVPMDTGRLNRLVFLAFEEHRRRSGGRLFDDEVFNGLVGPFIPHLDERLRPYRRLTLAGPIDGTGAGSPATAATPHAGLLEDIWNSHKHDVVPTLQRFGPAARSPWGRIAFALICGSVAGIPLLLGFEATEVAMDLAGRDWSFPASLAFHTVTLVGGVLIAWAAVRVLLRRV